MGKVYIVHCVDTEGPLYEESIVPFEQIKKIFGIDIEPTRDNLIKLQKGQLDLHGKEEAVCRLVDIHRITTRGSWDEIDQMLQVITSDEYRNEVKDSDGNGWKFNWFCMDHVGFTGINPRRRDAGYHKVFDHYVKLCKQQEKGDFIGFHYHPLPISGNYHESGTAYWGGENLNQIFCHKIIDRMWFPAGYRPGFHTERPDSNWFLEQWIPFDYGNQSFVEKESGQSDMDGGRYGDWRYAPLDWYPYHPDHDDYQKIGSCRRWITRCLNMYARIRQISQDDVDEAFKNAEKGQDVILAFTDHDYKDMKFEINRLRDMIVSAKEKYSTVSFIYSNAVEAMRKVLHLKEEKFHLDVFVDKTSRYKKLIVRTKNKIFGPQPFLAIKSVQGIYYWDNFDFSIPGEEWTYTFDSNTIQFETVEKIGVAANNAYGFTQVVLIDPDGSNTVIEYN